MPVMPFPEYAPDLADIAVKKSSLISGVLPRADGYGPFKSFQALTQSLPGPCRGLFYSRRTDSSIAIFGATSTHLYLLSNTDFSWSVVSKAGTPYSALPTQDNWTFAQFNDTIIACQINTIPQSYVLSSSAAFADLAGTPPFASNVAVIGGFLVLSGLSAAPKRVHWSDLFAITTWTAGVGLCDFQDFADGGSVLTVAGGDLFGVVFQSSVIRRMLYVPGSGAIFDFVVVSRSHALIGKYSVIPNGDTVFFYSSLGFQKVDGGGQITPIGKERVDRTFAADLDSTNQQLLQGSIDPNSTRVFWAYKSGAGSAGLFDKMECFDYVLGRWSLVPMSGEFLAPISSPGITLESLDAIAPTPLNVTGAANNGSGRIRLTLNALSNASFDIHGQNFINVYGVVGTTEANAAWAFTIIDATHIDLVGSTFTNAYVSGGHIGGSLDALTFSLDSVSTSSIAQIAMVNSTHKLGFFSGANIEAILETQEESDDGDLLFLSAVSPVTDCAEGLVSIGYRNTAQGDVTYSPEQDIDSEQGAAGALVEGRYLKARLRCPAGSTWTFASGVYPDVQSAGDA